MNGSPISEFGGLNERLAAFWLPPSTRGNGLSAPRWAAIADVTPGRADALLVALGVAGVPARAARVWPRSLRNVDTRVWVDPDRYARAENVLLAELAVGSSASSRGPKPAEILTSSDSSSWRTITDTRTVDHLRMSQGFCVRHAWLYLRLEDEMSDRPLGNAVMYEDLVHQAVQVIDGRRGAGRRLRALAAHEPCLICDYGADSVSHELGAPASWTGAWVSRSATVWARRRCPRCLPDAASADGVVCRAHAIRRDLAGPRLRDYVSELEARMHNCVESLRQVNTPSADSDAALIEAVGWFAGWQAGACCLGGVPAAHD